MRARLFFLLTMAAAAVYITLPVSTWAQSLDELQSELEAKRESLRSAEEKISQYKEQVQQKRQEARTLSQQIGLIDDSIGEIELNINRTVAEIDETAVAIEAVNAEIEVREAEIAVQKQRLAEYIRTLHMLDQQSPIAIFLKYSTFSAALSEASTVAELQERGQETLVSVQQLKEELETKQRELEDFQQTLVSLQERQEKQQQTLAVQRTSKERILSATEEEEEQFQALLKQAQQAHQAAEADISRLDELIREELRKQGRGALPSVGVMDWPINPVFGVSCEFHCGGYPYAYLIGPHSGMDIPSYVGTPILAPADGHVARTHDAGGPGYSYILLLHGDNVSTVYGHVSGFAVSEGQTVTRGTVIGYTGGAPGSRGAGLSSGPHLHFEVRVNNSPTNPRNYL